MSFRSRGLGLASTGGVCPLAAEADRRKQTTWERFGYGGCPGFGFHVISGDIDWRRLFVNFSEVLDELAGIAREDSGAGAIVCSSRGLFAGV